jgi:polyhydroxyalkanoate synthesis regulator phasin
MEQNEVFRRYLDLGAAFTHVTRERAEDLMRELVRLGDLQREQAQQWVDDVLDRSRKNTEVLLDLIREEVARQLSSMSLVTRDDVSRLVTRLSRAPAAARKATGKKVTKKATAKKVPASKARKAPAKKAPAKKAPAKKATAKKAPAKKATAKKSTTKRAAPAKKSTKKAGS